MTKEQLPLVILMEECDELSQRASKALRFGLHEVQDGQSLTNEQRLIYEFNDVVATMEYLYGDKYISNPHDGVAAGLKKIKINKWLEHSRNQGALTDYHNGR